MYYHKVLQYSRYEGTFNEPLRAGEFPGCCEALVKELKSLPAYQGGPLYRGTRLSRVESIAGTLEVGSILQDPAFFSTSACPDQAKGFMKDCMIKIVQSHSGRDISHISNHPGEEEILFLPGTQFEVVCIYDNVQFTTIEVVEQGEEEEEWLNRITRFNHPTFTDEDLYGW